MPVEDVNTVEHSPSKIPCKMPLDSVILRFAKLTEKAVTPTRGSKLAAGYDLYSAYEVVVPAHGKVIAKTDIQIALPDGCYGRVAPRSGLAAKHFIDVGVKRGDRIAQLICERIYMPDLQEEEKLDDTERGIGGYGSTDKN